MNAAVAKKEVESVLASRFGNVFERYAKQPPEILPTGVAELDALAYGFPRGAITEFHGALSSGRTSLLLAALAEATAREETCAVIDCSATFDVLSAKQAGIDFERLLWVRCGDNLERAFKSVDLLLHGGGFGFITLILSDIPAKSVRRIISSWWFRFRRAIENSPTVLLVMTPVSCVKSCAAMALELTQEAIVWPGTLSLIYENHDGGITNQPGPTRLSLVNSAASLPVIPLPTNAYVLKKLCLRVDRERPTAWANRTVRFTSYLAQP